MDADLLATFAAEIRDRLTPDDEGAIWALYLDREDRPLLASAIEDGMAHITDERLHALVYVLANVGAHAVLVAIPRRDGSPLDADRRLQRALRTLMAGERTRLVDVIVVGDYEWSSLRGTHVAEEGVA